MAPTRKGSFHLFRFAGIDVFLHWSWFLVALFEVNIRASIYSSVIWNILEYLALFGIVLLHEFGHALACRQVGGHADQIVLWPLGGVAYVDPPQRPGATLWSLVAGPLVNVVLAPVFYLLLVWAQSWGWADTAPNVFHFLWALWIIDLVLLVFNLLPVFPLDGGQILRSLLWFVLGKARSLMVASSIGFLGVVGVAYLAFREQSIWIGLIAVFILLNCWSGFQQARFLLRINHAVRHTGWECPSCHQAPPSGIFWHCGQCYGMFDLFVARGVCPHCGTDFQVGQCLNCGAVYPLEEWDVGDSVSSESHC